MQFIEAKSILSKLRTDDPYFGITYNMNLYRGCQHACIYCDTRSECYGNNDISKISVKSNALELLTKELHTKRKARATIGTGSMNDPYMPLEKDLEMTRRALQIIAFEKFPVHVITKSDLVARDSDILQEIAKTYAAVSFTITTYDDNMAKTLEPCAPKSSDRFKAMEQLAKPGIYAGVTLMPVLPFINDTRENLENIMIKAKDSGASYVLFMPGMTLRKGSREYFYKALDCHFAGVKERYESYFGEKYICNSPNYRMLMNTFYNLAAKNGIETKIRFYQPAVNKQLNLWG
jgi:DNA repair photolyase